MFAFTYPASTRASFGHLQIVEEIVDFFSAIFLLGIFFDEPSADFVLVSIVAVDVFWEI